MSSKYHRRIATLFATCATFVFLSPPVSAGTVTYSVNSAFAPALDAWTVPDVGWLFTVPSTFTLTEVETLFSSADSRTVTLEIYSGIPNDSGTALLATSTFTPVGGSYSGAAITPITLTVGLPYFVGFKNVSGIGVNYTDTANPAVVDLPLYFDVAPPPYYSILQTGYATGRPILLFETQEVPEPAGVWLTGLGICLLLVGRRRFLQRS
jgi:hypothetical protein